MTVTRTTRLGVYRWSEDLDAFTRSQMDLSHESIETRAAVFTTGTTLPVAAPEHERSFFYKSNDEILYFFNGTNETGSWVAINQYGTTGQMATITYGSVNSAGTVDAVARIDHTHKLPDVYLGNYVEKSLITAKGDIFAGTGNNSVIKQPIGASNTVLTADPASATGMVWREVDLSNLIPKSLVDAKGELIVGTANNLVDSVPAGTDGQMLVANSANPLGVVWSGAPVMQAFYERVRSWSTVTSNISVGNGYNVETLTLGANIAVTLYAGDLLPGTTGKAYSLTLIVANDGTANRLITFPGSVKWANGIRPTEDRAANKTNIWSLVTYDGGASWFGFLTGRGF